MDVFLGLFHSCLTTMHLNATSALTVKLDLHTHATFLPVCVYLPAAVFSFCSCVSDLEEDKITVCLSVCVLSMLVFLLAPCCFHVKEEGNEKKNTQVFHFSPGISPNLRRWSLPPNSRLLLPFVLFWDPHHPGAREAPLAIPARSHSCGCCQLRTVSRLHLKQGCGCLCGWHQGSLSSLEALWMCFGVFFSQLRHSGGKKYMSMVDQIDKRLRPARRPATILVQDSKLDECTDRTNVTENEMLAFFFFVQKMDLRFSTSITGRDLVHL